MADFIGELRERRVLPAVGVYVASSWVLIEILDRLQQAQNMPQLALASVNYALAIWKDADDGYVMADRAKRLAAELRAMDQ